MWVNLYRPGNISFNSLSGVCQPHKNRLMLMLKGSIQLGQVPAFALNFDLMPVDFLARFIAFHASRYSTERAVFNLHNPEPLSWDAYVASFRETGSEFRWSVSPTGNSNWAGSTPTTRCSACSVSTSTASRKTSATSP